MLFRRYFLVLMAGPSTALPRPKDGDGEEGEEEAEAAEGGSRKRRRGPGRDGGGGSKRHPGQKGKAWVLKKKEQMRGKGVEVAADSRYTARKRRHAF